MGTVLTNPYDLNFGGLAARNAETVIKAVETLTMGNLRYDVISSVATACNSQDNYVVYVMKITTIDTGNVKYRVQYTSDGRNPIDSPQINTTGGDFTNESDATTEQNRFVTERNVFRAEDGCSNSNALNYSYVASSNPCPCSVSTPVWTQGQNSLNNPQLQSVAERAGDCSCLMPPTNLDGQGYLVEEWEYVGTPWNPPELDPNPPYSRLTDQWKWKRNTSKSVLPQSGEDDILYAIAKPGWKATGLNPPQEFIVKNTLAPSSWSKYRLTTATGFVKMGCLDNTAMNYDSEATIDSQDCKYCTDSDINATIYNQETQKCECIEGYSLKVGLFGSKCKKGVAKSGTNQGSDPKDEDEDEGMSVGTLMAGIAGITVLGLTVLTLSGGKSNE